MLPRRRFACLEEDLPVYEDDDISRMSFITTLPHIPNVTLSSNLNRELSYQFLYEVDTIQHINEIYNLIMENELINMIED